MKNRTVAVGLAAALLGASCLAGCGKGSSHNQSAGTGSFVTPAPAPTGDNQPLKYNCAAAKPAVAPPGSPVDDLLGVRLGMAPSLVAATWACGNSQYVISNDDGASFEMPSIERGPQPHTSVSAQNSALPQLQITATPQETGTPSVDDRVEALLLGLPGHEQAARLTRQVHYAAGHEPSLAVARQGLIDKYGPPTSDTGMQMGVTETMAWFYEPSGRPMSPHNPSYDQCRNEGGYHSSFSVEPGCGLSIAGTIIVSSNDSVSGVNVTIMNQAAANAAIETEKAAIAVLNKPTAAATKF